MSRRPRDPGTAISQRLLRWLAANDSCGTGSLLVGFSGGNDSLALALAMREIRPALRRNVILIHVDHALRPDSAAAADEASILAEGLGFSIETVRLEHGLAERHSGAGIEEAARRERYAVLSRFSQKHGDAPILTAHHRDDQAETVLLHLLRGAGLAGVTGMSEISTLIVPWWKDYGEAESKQIAIWRPFLKERRTDLEQAVYNAGLSAIEDPTNAGLDYRRNQIRRRVLPAIEDVVPGGTEALTRFARIAADDDAFLETIAQGARRNVHDEDNRLDGRSLIDLHPAIARRVVMIAMREKGVEHPTLDRIDAVLALARAEHGGATIEIGSGYSATLDRGWIVIRGPAEGNGGVSV